ncbi:MAG TPA: glycosyltransferase family 39 protein [Pirellulales bacterium]|nr:glycosyltransferase family 39 protein [Pirellulales bacterium]
MNMKAAVIPALVCLAVNAALFAAVAVRRPQYLADYGQNANPDAKHYVLLGRNLIEHHHYSRSSGPPYQPDMLRTPVYPLFAGFLDLLGGAGCIYVMQALLQAVSCLILFQIVSRCFGPVAGGTAALLFATDLMLAASNFEAMSEPLCSFLVVAGLFYWLKAFHAEFSSTGSFWSAAASGIFLAAAILTRPATLYLTGLFAVVTILAPAERVSGRQRGLMAAVILASSFAPAGLWIARNYAVHSLARLSPVDATIMVYFAGAGAYQVERGITLEQAQEAISEEFHLPPHVVVQNDFKSKRTVAEMDAALRRARWPVLLKYPKALVISSTLGVAKALVSHNVGNWANLLALKWSPPGMGNLLRLRGEGFQALLGNPPLLVAVFAWELLHTAAVLLLALIGILFSLKRRAFQLAPAVLLAGFAYFIVMIAPFGLEAYYRCRAPAAPFLCAFAGCGAAALVNALSRRKESLTPSPLST